MQFKKISVIGLGYIGLPTAAVIASRNVPVVGVDVNKRVVDTINRGQIHIVEPELDMLVHSVVNMGHLRATPEAEKADAFLIAVPTPFSGPDHKPDLSYIEAATKMIAPVLERGNLVILESTSPVGTTEQVARWLATQRPDLKIAGQTNPSANVDIKVAYCPERVLPGRVLHELVENDRTIGGLDVDSAEAARALYRLFVRGELLLTDSRTAEMVKLTENAFRDVNIAFANELSLICDELSIDVWELIKLSNRHPRVNILQPGPGVGGHCIAVDPWFIVSSVPSLAKLICTARQVNDSKPAWVVSKVQAAVKELNKSRCVVACFGLTFKANIDDLRESPSLAIAAQLAQDPALEILAVEPNIRELNNTKLHLVDVNTAISSADVVVILVDHHEFKSLDYSKFKNFNRLIDCRGISS